MMNTFFRTIILLTCCWISTDLWAANQLQPQLALSPSRIEMHPDKENTTESITVLNLGTEPMQVQVSVQNWDLDEQNAYRALPPTPQSLDQWLIINPVRLTIPPKSQQTVRLAVRPKAKPQAGEHRAMVFFHQLPRDNSKGVNVLFKVGVPIYAFFGDTRHEATLHSMTFEADKRELVFDVSNSGNAYVRPRGYYMVVSADNTESEQGLLNRLNAKTGEVEGDKPLASGKLASKPVFAGERRTVQASIAAKEKLPATYLLAVKVDVAGTIFEKVYTIQPDK